MERMFRFAIKARDSYTHDPVWFSFLFIYSRWEQWSKWFLFVCCFECHLFCQLWDLGASRSTSPSLEPRVFLKRGSNLPRAEFCARCNEIILRKSPSLGQSSYRGAVVCDKREAGREAIAKMGHRPPAFAPGAEALLPPPSASSPSSAIQL